MVSRFYGSLHGRTKEVTRTGTHGSGISGHIRGWDFGVKVEMHVDEGDNDVAIISLTGGSIDSSSAAMIGTFRKEDVGRVKAHFDGVAWCGDCERAMQPWPLLLSLVLPNAISAKGWRCEECGKTAIKALLDAPGARQGVRCSNCQEREAAWVIDGESFVLCAACCDAFDWGAARREDGESTTLVLINERSEDENGPD